MRTAAALLLSVLLLPLPTPRAQSARLSWDVPGSGALVPGDVDLDGVVDAVVAEPFFPDLMTSQGRVRCLSGRDQSPLYSIAGNPGSILGVIIDDLGDINDDHFPDFIVQDSANTYTHDGRTGVRQAILPINGQMCTALADLDGDGAKEFAIGGNGSLGVYSGRTLEVVHFLTYGGLFGGSAAALDDLDGDSIPEFVVGEFADRMTAIAGLPTVRVFSGSSGRVLLSLQRPEDIRNLFAPIYFGESVSRAGDITGDGICDIAVGSTLARGGRGAVFFYDGRTGELVDVKAPDKPDTYGNFVFEFSRSMWPIGDVNNNGFEDLAVIGQIGMVPVRSHIWIVDCGTRETLYLLGNAFRAKGAWNDWDGDGFLDFILGRKAFELLSGIPIGVTVEGPASAGSDPIRVGASGVPRSGSAYKIHLIGVLPGTRALLALGFGGGGSLARGRLSKASTSSLVGFDVTQFLPVRAHQIRPGEGQATVELQLPDDPMLVGSSFLVRWVVPSAASDQLRLSQTLRIEIQPAGPVIQ